MKTYRYRLVVQEVDGEETSKLDELCRAWSELKQCENNAKESRLQVEAVIASLVHVPEEGTANHLTGFYKCKTVGNLKRTLNLDNYLKIEDQIPEKLRPVKRSVVLDNKKIKELERVNPEVYGVLVRGKAISVSKSNPTIKVEELEQ
jgi:hypothetical protein